MKETKIQELEKRIKDLEDMSKINRIPAPYIPQPVYPYPSNTAGMFPCSFCGQWIFPGGTHYCQGYRITC